MTSKCPRQDAILALLTPALCCFQSLEPWGSHAPSLLCPKPCGPGTGRDSCFDEHDFLSNFSGRDPRFSDGEMVCTHMGTWWCICNESGTVPSGAGFGPILI